MTDPSSVGVQGTCDERFAPVREAFERNFAELGEVGASVAVTVEGRTVVDLWGGLAHPESRRPWERDTVVVVWSATKGATALCAHLLADRGELDLDASESATFLMLMNSGGYMTPGKCDTRAAHAAELPSSGGVTNARGLAGLYLPLIDAAYRSLGYTSDASGAWAYPDPSKNAPIYQKPGGQQTAAGPHAPFGCSFTPFPLPHPIEA